MISRSRRARRLAWGPLILVSALVAGVVPFAPSTRLAGAQSVEDPGNGVRVAGTWDRIPADVRALFGDSIMPENFDLPIGHPKRTDTRGLSDSAGTMLLFADMRQMWQLYPHDIFNATKRGIYVVIRNLDTMAITKTFDIPGVILYRGGGRAEWVHALDPGKRLFLAASDGDEIMEIDLRTHQMKRYGFRFSGVETLGGAQTLRNGGITYDPYDGPAGSLLGLFGGPGAFGAANVNNFLYKRDLATGQVATSRQLRACSGPLPSTENNATYTFPLLPTPEYLYIPCHRSGSSGQVVRLARASAYVQGSPEDVVVGPVVLETAFVDAGSRRMHLVTQAGEDWVFDARTMSFIGVIAGKSDEKSLTTASFGFEPFTGRFFFRSRVNGFGVAEGRFFPIPQARTTARPVSEAHERIWGDPVTGRVFQLDGLRSDKVQKFTVYKVDEAPAPPPLPDPDANTVDRDEQHGVTDVRYFGNASGFGARAVIARGLVTVPPSPAVASISVAPLVTSQYLNSRCGYTDRELVAGRVFKTEYDTGSTASEAIAVGVDERTKVDLDRPSRCDLSGKDANGSEVFKGLFGTAPAELELDRRTAAPEGEERWGRGPAACSSSEGDNATTGRGQDPPAPVPALGESIVKCPMPGQPMEAFAESKLDGQVKVGDAWTRTNVWKDNDGVHSRAESVAKGIDIASGAITINEIRSIAESTSNGRPKGAAMSKHRIEISRVAVGGSVLCQVCVPEQVVVALNTLLVGRAQFRIAEGLDGRLLQGTPKGALTAVQKSLERQISDQSLIGDFTNEVPAFEMIIYNDHYYWGRARQLYQFAGVGTVATYNITVQPTGLGPDDDASVDEDTDDSGVGTDGNGTLDGTDVAGGSEIDGATGAVAGGNGAAGGILKALSDAAKAVLRGIRVFFTQPRQALLLLTAWALLLLPGYLGRRRRLLTAAGGAA